MKVTGLDGKQHKWNLIGHVPLMDDTRRCSQYHERARELLSELFPLERILEEVPLPGSGQLTADFFVPMKKIMVEVHGQQHYEYSAFLHGTEGEFKKGQQRDKNKRSWCELNNIRLVELPYWETNDEWKSRFGRRTVTQS